MLLHSRNLRQSVHARSEGNPQAQQTVQGPLSRTLPSLAARRSSSVLDWQSTCDAETQCVYRDNDEITFQKCLACSNMICEGPRCLVVKDAHQIGLFSVAKRIVNYRVLHNPYSCSIGVNQRPYQLKQGSAVCKHQRCSSQNAQISSFDFSGNFEIVIQQPEMSESTETITSNS